MRKAQMSLMTRPIVLVLTITVLLILIQTIYSGTGSERQKEKEFDLRTVATNILLILSNYEECLAFRAPVILGSYANIVEKSRLDYFAEKYPNIEPPCARNYDYGWRVRVFEINNKSEVVKTWVFGAAEFSKGKALRQGIITNMPIGIRYSNKDVRPGKVEIELVDGELERLAGFIDQTCDFGRARDSFSNGKQLTLSYGSYYTGNELCIGYGKNKACRQLLCDAIVYPNLNPGRYYLTADYKNNTLFVSA